MRIKSVKSDYWDTNNSDNWASASLNSYLNGTYLNNQLNSTAKSQIVSHDWSIGAIAPGNNDLANQINDENSEKWNGKIALPTVSEYIRTNSDSTCNTYIQGINCRYNTWMFTSDKNGFWTLSPADVPNLPFYANTVSNGVISHTTVNGKFGYGTAPTVYLSSDLTLSGSGTQSDPYTIS